MIMSNEKKYPDLVKFKGILNGKESQTLRLSDEDGEGYVYLEGKIRIEFTVETVLNNPEMFTPVEEKPEPVYRLTASQLEEYGTDFQMLTVGAIKEFLIANGHEPEPEQPQPVELREVIDKAYTEFQGYSHLANDGHEWGNEVANKFMHIVEMLKAVKVGEYTEEDLFGFVNFADGRYWYTSSWLKTRLKEWKEANK